MVISKCVLIVLIFSLLAFGLFCSADNAGGRKPYERDPREQYEQCQRRCKWEATVEREQQQCEQSCERQFKEAQRQQEERGRRHDLNPEDPQRRYQECRERCEQEEQRQRPQCQQRCQAEYEQQQKQQRQCQERCEGQRETQQCQKQCQQREREEPQQKYQQCRERCEEQKHGQREQQECQRECRQRYEEQERDAQENKHHRHKESWSEEEEEEGQQTDNPYYFPQRRSFQTRFRDEQGNARILQRFVEKSHLLQNINNFRFGVIEANPNTVILPHHTDAEKILFVTNGRGKFTIVTHENKESFNVQRGTVLRIPAGSTLYIVNQDNREKLTIAALAQPLNQPDKLEEFFPVGNKYPQSYLQTFSNEVLETILNSPREELQRIFQTQKGQQRQQGIFRKARPEQIRAMTQEATSPRQREERFVINLLNQSPVYANQNGRFFEACPDEFSQLRDMNVAVSALTLNEGSILVPHYNSKATYVALVTDGSAEVEMACPHLSKQSQESPRKRHDKREQEEESEEWRTGQHKSIRFRLSTGDVAVFPAGHPITIYARDQNLEAIGFALNAQNNQKIFLAGKKNMIRQMDSEVKEISFGVPARLVDNIFNKPQESYFMSLSHQRQGGEERSESS